MIDLSYKNELDNDALAAVMEDVRKKYVQFNKQMIASKSEQVYVDTSEEDLKNEILSFFKKENWPQIEAEKFFNHYQGIGWKIGGKIKIVDWQATAQNWMLKFKEIQTEKNTFLPPVQNKDNLHTNRNKNYNQPL